MPVHVVDEFHSVNVYDDNAGTSPVVASQRHSQIKLGIEHCPIGKARQRITLQGGNVHMHQYGMPLVVEIKR